MMMDRDKIMARRKLADERTDEMLEAFTARFGKDAGTVVSESIDMFDNLAAFSIIAGRDGPTMAARNAGVVAQAVALITTACCASRGTLDKKIAMEISDHIAVIFKQRFLSLVGAR